MTGKTAFGVAVRAIGLLIFLWGVHDVIAVVGHLDQYTDEYVALTVTRTVIGFLLYYLPGPVVALTYRGSNHE